MAHASSRDARAAALLQRLCSLAVATPPPAAPGLFSGAAGEALFLAAASSLGMEGAAEAAQRRLAHALEVGVAEHGLEGLTGAGWVAHQMFSPQVLARPELQLLDRLDAELITRLGDGEPRAAFDLMTGVAGVALYAAGRAAHPHGPKLLDLVLTRLEALGERDGDGLRWFTAPELLPQGPRDEAPAGYYCLGLAHGTPGVLCALERLTGCAAVAERATRLADEAARWLWAQRSPTPDGSAFPGRVGPYLVAASRHAWCYGDLGVALALSPFSERHPECVPPSALEQLAVAFARRATAQLDTVELNLCHGLSGNLFQLTGAARRWPQLSVFAELARAALLERCEAGSLSEVPVSTVPEPSSTLDLLNGWSGVGLALARTFSAAPPQWEVGLGLC